MSTFLLFILLQFFGQQPYHIGEDALCQQYRDQIAYDNELLFALMDEGMSADEFWAFWGTEQGYLDRMHALGCNMSQSPT
jgi:hypothetical protein